MRVRLGVAFLGFAIVAGCGHHPAPYGRGQAPPVETLLEATEPQVAAMTVPDAGLVLNRTIRGDLAMLAEAPGRLRGSISKGGNELVSLALHDGGYALRYKLDDLPKGFYTGSSSTCVIEAVLGIPLSAESLVALVLGGGPILTGEYEILRQGWNRKEGFESLVIADAHYEEELQFTRHGDRWALRGASLWHRRGGARGDRIWAFEHGAFTTTDGHILPGKTQVWAPGRRKDNLIVISYRSRDLSPAWASSSAASAATDANEAGAAPATSGVSTGAEDDGWGDDEGWENEDAPDPASPEITPAEPPEPPKEPALFELDPTGLTVRGDLCPALGSHASF